MKDGKVIISLIFLLILSIGLGQVNASAFTDMPSGWSKEAMENAIASGILKGSKGKIMPKKPMTRAELATISSRVLGLEEMEDISNFKDLEGDEWYYEYIAKAVGADILKGRSEDLMEPNSHVSREEAFVIMARIFAIDKTEDQLSSFKDANQLGAWSRDYINSLVAEGYILGNDDKRLRPKDKISREEFAQVLYSMVDDYIEEDLSNKEIDGNLILNSQVNKLENLTINGDLIIGEGIRFNTLDLINVKVKGRLVIRPYANVRILEGSQIEKLVLVKDKQIKIDDKSIIKSKDEDVNIKIIDPEEEDRIELLDHLSHRIVQGGYRIYLYENGDLLTSEEAIERLKHSMDEVQEILANPDNYSMEEMWEANFEILDLIYEVTSGNVTD